MYQVEWTTAALDALAEIWLVADSATRFSVRKSIDHLLSSLSVNPENIGESRDRGRRVAFVELLAVRYEIQTRLPLVTILHVRLIRKRGE